MKNKKLAAIIGSAVLILILIVGIAVKVGFGKSKNQATGPTPIPTARPDVNLIDIKQRPYVTLQPLSDRNVIEFAIHNLPKKSTDVEVLLEYDRNKGIPDAVLKDFSLSSIPYVDQIFLGSKSTGGHITYHEDVIGGQITLTFAGSDPYSLQVPWRYDDTQPHYTEFSTADEKFQLVLDQPFRTPKIIVMQSPGLPAELEGTVVAGPYLVRGVGPLPQTNAKLTIHLNDVYTKVKLYGFDGQKWQEFDNTLQGRTVTATVPFVETYVVTQ